MVLKLSSNNIPFYFSKNFLFIVFATCIILVAFMNCASLKNVLFRGEPNQVFNAEIYNRFISQNGNGLLVTTESVSQYNTWIPGILKYWSNSILA